MAWTPESQPFGQNRAPILTGWASDGSGVGVPVAVDPVTGRILVNSSGGGNTQYTDGGTPPTHPIGGTLEWNNAGTWATVGSSAPLPINTATATGSAVPANAFYMAGNKSGNLTGLNLDSSSNLLVNVANLGLGTFGQQDGNSAGVFSALVYNEPLVYNGSTWDRMRSIGGVSGTTGLLAAGISDGTNTANVLASGTAQSTGNGLLIGLTGQSVTFSSTITTGTANLASTDAGNYNIVAVQLFQLGSGAASIAFQGSNDNSTWYSIPLNRQSVSLSTPSFNTTAADMYAGALPFRYFRLQLSGQTGGTTSGTVFFKTGNYSPLTIGGQLAINGTQATNVAQINGVTPLMGNGVTGTGSQRVTIASDNTPFKVGIDQTTPGTTNNVSLSVSSGAGTSNLIKDDTQFGDGVSSGIASATNRLYNGSTYDRARSGGVTGMTGVSLQASPSGGWSFTNISTSTTTTVKSGSGTFHLVCVNTLGTVASTCTFYDNTAGSGTVIAIINSLTLSGTFTFDVAFATGLTVVTTGTAAPNITVAWK